MVLSSYGGYDFFLSINACCNYGLERKRCKVSIYYDVYLYEGEPLKSCI